MKRPRSALHTTFAISIAFKGIDGVLEIIGAALLLMAKPAQIQKMVGILTQHELSRDPDDAVANYLVHAAEQLSVSGQLFGSVFLLFHGVVKIVLVWALLKSKLWAYPLAILIFAAFAVYQTYRYAKTHSAEMVVLTVLDVIVIALAWAEYRRLRRDQLSPA
jgi:uncharacterized membrane protein